MSHPVRGAWIEMDLCSVPSKTGVRGLKWHCSGWHLSGRSHPISVTRIGINHLLLTGRFNAAGARLTDSVLEHGVKLHIRYLLLKSGFLRRKVVLQGRYPALQLVDINALEALERFLRRVELRLVVVTGCPDFLNLAGGLVVFAELLFKLGFFSPPAPLYRAP